MFPRIIEKMPEIQHLDGLAPKRLRDRHTSYSLGGVRQYLDAAPIVDVEVSLRHGDELQAPAVVHARPVIPMPAVGNLKLNATDRVERFFYGLRAAAKDEHAGLMVGISRDMPHRKHQPVAAVSPSPCR